MANIHPPIITEADVHAVRKVIAGEATPEEQRRAMIWIGDQACRRMDSPYEPGIDPLDQGVLMGRHLVGVLISNMTTGRTLDAARAADKERTGAVPNFNPLRADPRVNKRRSQL